MLIKENNKYTNRYELDTHAKFVVFEQDVAHLSDEDLFKYLHDYHVKEKHLNKLVEISNFDLRLYLNDMSPVMFDKENPVFNSSECVFITTMWWDAWAFNSIYLLFRFNNLDVHRWPKQTI